MNSTRLLQFVLLIGGVFLIGGLLMPSLSTPAEHTQRSIRFDNLRTLMRAVHAYEADYQRFPTLTHDCKNRLSWRVALLPYLDEQSLFDQIDKTVDWNHPNNRPFHTQMPSVFQEPSAKSSSMTPYLAIAGSGTGWPESEISIGFSQISDGSSNTISLIALPDKQMNWLSPDTMTLSEFVKYFENLHDNRLCYALFDGSTQDDQLPITSSELESSFLISDAE